MTDKTADLPPGVHLSDVQQELETLTGMSLWARVKLSYLNMRLTTRGLISERPSEARLLFFVLLSDMIFFLSRGISLVVTPGAAAQDALPLSVGLWLIGVLLVRTACLYVFSAAVCAVSRLFGGTGSWRDTRTGVFWASLVASPIGVIGALVSAGFAHLEAFSPVFAEPMVAGPPLLIGVVAFVFFLAAGVAEAQDFRRTAPVFVTFSVLTVVGLIGALALVSSLGLAG